LAFLPLAALMVDYALTIAISVAAGASAIIAYLPGLAPARLALAFVLLVTVACVSLFGHGGRAVFALMTISFVIIGSVVIIRGIQAAPVHQAVADAAATFPHSPPAGVLLAFPVGMASLPGSRRPHRRSRSWASSTTRTICGSAAPRYGSWWRSWSG
jgi:hypothetical protein